MAEVDSKLATPDGQPLDGVGRNSRGQGEHHSTGLWMGPENRHPRVPVVVIFPLKRVGQHKPSRTRGPFCANVEECIGSIAVIGEVLDQETIFAQSENSA